MQELGRDGPDKVEMLRVRELKNPYKVEMLEDIGESFATR